MHIDAVMEEIVIRELEKYRLQLTAMWQENQATVSTTSSTSVNDTLPFPTSPSDLSGRYKALEPDSQKQLLPIKAKSCQECQHPFSYPHSCKPGNAKPIFFIPPS